MWFPQLHCQLHLSLGGSGVLADPTRIGEEFRKGLASFFCRSGQREGSFDEFNREFDGRLPLLHEVHFTLLTGQVFADVVQRKGAIAGSLDGWCWRELKVLLVSWFDELARVLSKVVECWRLAWMGYWMLTLP